MLKKPKKRFSRVLSAVLAVMIAAPNLMQLAASAEEGEKFQYTMFGRNGITMSVSSNLCMNGNLHTNKDAAITATNKNINGKLTTSADIEKRVKHVYADRKIYDTYFATNCELHEEEYVYSDINIHINNPLYCYGNIMLDGNVSLNSSLGTLMNINITGEVKNANNSVVYSKYGNITIENDSVANVNGLIYAPLGTVTINASNVNLNGVIIADQVVINGSSVNINCNDNIARFIGETSEEYDFSGLEYLPEEWLGDTDTDDLFDIYEKVIDSDPFNPDTDGDGLPDGYEVLTLNTDPLEIDTDGNGVLDGNEDFDTDNLVNIDEFHNQTLPFTPDTDEDGFVDGDEVHIYGTIPTNPDTDGDGLLDGEESYDGSIYLGYGVYFDPLNPDTDGDGIADGDEVFGQTKEQEVQTQDEAITAVIVDMETNGNIDRTLTVESMQGIDAMTSNVYALVGEPFNFETESDFESATITFKIDQSKLGDTQFDNLLILWYNEEKQIFEEMPTTHDAVNSTVSTTTTHFSQYMIVDSVKWYDNWNRSLTELQKMWTGNTSYTRKLHTIYLVDCSASMASTDPYGRSLEIGYKGITAENIEEKRNEIDSPGEEYSYTVPWCQRADICKALLDRKGENEAACLITFSNGIINDFAISNNYDYTKEKILEISGKEGVADFNNAFSRALIYVDTDTTDLYRIVVITNSDMVYDTNNLPYIPSNVMLNFFNMGETPLDYSLEELANDTKGGVFDVTTQDSLLVQVGGVVTIPSKYIGEDSDEDNIPNLVEEYGLMPNGSPIGTSSYKKDTDGDSIPDNEELGLVMGLLEENFDVYEYVRALKPHSDPAKADTDGDEVEDNIDDEPTNKYLGMFVKKLTDMEHYIEEYWTTDEAEHNLYNGVLIKKDTSIVAMNIIRYINYGSDSKMEEIKWYFTSGDSYDLIRDYIDDKDPTIMQYFEKYSTGEEIFYDPDDQEVDILHLLATLSGQYNTVYIGSELIDKDLSGWAGDLQSLIYDLKKKTYGKDEDLYESAYTLIAKDGTYFNLEDMISDVDARNMYTMYNTNNNLSFIIRDYYKSNYQNRYAEFVNGYGGFDKLEEIANEFTQGYGLIKHHILHGHAKAAANEPEVYSIYMSSYLCTIDGVDYYKLPDPKIVRLEESKALTYAFITFLKEQINQ